MNWLTWSLVPLVFLGFWMYTSTLSASFPSLQNKRILLLIAHPDDEAMFFAPTLLALTRPENGNHVKLLCLSSGMSSATSIKPQQLTHACTTGDADGLGETRKQELVKSGLQLGIRSKDDILIIEDR
jgi:N-acetylglucosaminylphosphatidylinositol deacetylase